MPALDMLLAGLARERSTGALRVGRSGTIFLDAGRVAYMECADTPGAEDVLAASGRVSEQTLGAARREGAGSRLVEDARSPGASCSTACSGRCWTPPSSCSRSPAPGRSSGRASGTGWAASGSSRSRRSSASAPAGPRS
ncbi:hypothetical protein [Nonomuraea recticatena]|uniref:hypothetical protein n=1 Tax=Nonomuraea recticatena TaxID=46178 RepID=UPI003622E546